MSTAVANDQNNEVSAFERLGFFQRRQLGFTVSAVREATVKLAKAGEIKAVAAGVDAIEAGAWKQGVLEAIAAQIIQDNVGAWRELAGTSERDWSEFFNQLISFLERLMPFIQMLLTIFGGL
jgi:hypothetical protein